MARPRQTQYRAAVQQDKHGYWKAVVTLGYDSEGRRLRKKVRRANKADCIAAVAALEAEARLGTFERLEAKSEFTERSTLADWMGYQLTLRRNKMAGGKSDSDATLTGRLTATRNYILPTLGQLRLNQITVVAIEKALMEMKQLRGPNRGKRISPATEEAVLKALAWGLKPAHDQGLITRNPVEKVVRRTVDKTSEIRPLTPDELQRALFHANQTTNPARWYVALLCGLRQGEALALRWSEVDFVTNTIKVRHSRGRQVWRHGCSNVLECTSTTGSRCPEREPLDPVGKTKTASSVRNVPMSDVVQKVLAHHRLLVAQRLGRELFPADLVFSTSSGRPLDYSNDARSWKNLLKRCGIEERRLHDARHTAVTNLMASQVVTGIIEGSDGATSATSARAVASDRMVMDMFGWSSPRMLGTYAHPVDEVTRAALNHSDRLAGVVLPPEMRRVTGLD